MWLEPWGEDYGMSPGDEFAVVAADVSKDFYFHIGYEEKGLRLYAEGDARYVAVYQNGEALACGHNRREEEW